MCDKRYDLDCLDGILQSDAKSACGVAKPQVIPTQNNNTQLLSRRQSDQQQQEQQQQQSKQLQLFEGLHQAGDQVVAPVALGESAVEGFASTRAQKSSLHHQPSSKLSSSSVSQTISNSTGSMSSWRNEHLMTCMLITANVGTIFEESTLLELWFEQLKSYLVKIKPQLVAIHCQEVGGKNYETSMKNVSSFTDKILGDEKIISDYSRVRIFLDESFECLDKFTALGSLYLVHDSVDNVKLYNFKTAQYDTIEGRNILGAPDKRDLLEERKLNDVEPGKEQAQNPGTQKTSINKQAEHVEKIKFPIELFPECRSSRKGFMRTRWLFNDCQPLDLVNIHLFHDASNLVAMKTTPSPYAQNRQKALEFALRKIAEPIVSANPSNRGRISQKSTDGSSDCHARRHQEQVPLFIFGDFNFRLNTSKVIQRITGGLSPVIKKSSSNDEVLEIVYHRKISESNKEHICNECDMHKACATNVKAINEDNGNELEDGVLMTVGKKLFDYKDLDETFRATENTEWLLELDNELDSFKNQLHEFKISFSPSYPFKEDQTGGYSYMKTRCPAWCDRILFNDAGYRLISGKTKQDSRTDLVDGAAIDLDSEKKRIEFLQNQGDVIYRLMGNSVPMGDHKPVLLYCHLNISHKQQQQHQNQNPSAKCNHTVTSATTSGKPIEEKLVESTAM